MAEYKDDRSDNDSDNERDSEASEDDEQGFDYTGSSFFSQSQQGSQQSSLSAADGKDTNKRPRTVSNSRGGKRLSEYWSFAEPHPVFEKKCVCFCGMILNFAYAEKVDRLKKHLESDKCKAYKKLLASQSPENGISQYFAPNLTERQQEEFSQLVAMWFYMTGTPFYRISEPYFLKFCQFLRPNVRIPTRKQLANKYLEIAYDNTKGRIHKVFKNVDYLCLTTDAWTSVTALSIFNFVAVTPVGTYFSDCIYTGDASHSAEYTAQKIVEQVHKLGGFDKVAGVVTDNTRANKAAWKLLEKDHPNFFAIGCVCHTLHLLVHDIVDKIEWLSKIVIIQ